MLQLRQLTEDLLLIEGLADLHLERSKQGFLTLNGPCGQPLINITGIKVPSNLSKKEREYVYSLLKAYINKNADDIDFIYTAKKKDFRPEDISSKYNLTVSFTRSYYAGGTNHLPKSATLSCRKKEFSIHMSVDNKRNIEVTINRMPIEYHRAFDKLYEERVQILNSYVDALIEKDALDKKVQRLSVCNL